MADVERRSDIYEVGRHEWLFERTREGAHVTTTESFAGDPVEADTGGLQALQGNS
jgi:hypothetical protein